ncbi:MAG: hypothetical protein LBS61_06265 [Endomicrobium sp.]|nr:hypothetical protein [Endomicrobium sp.]
MESESESSDDIGKRIVAMTLPLVFTLATGYVIFLLAKASIKRRKIRRTIDKIFKLKSNK